MFMKLYIHNNERILAACDEDIIGKTFEQDGLKITVYESFYKGNSISSQVLVEQMRYATIMNLVGEEVVSIAILYGYISTNCIINVGGVKYAQAVIF